MYPRDTLFVKLVILVMNLALGIGRKPVRAAIRPVDIIERIAREGGLSPHFSQNVGPGWQVAIYRRQ